MAKREHGTARGAFQHRYHKEPECDPCRTARNLYASKAMRDAREQARGGKLVRDGSRSVCGKIGGFVKHHKEKTEVCYPCRLAKAEYEYARKWGPRWRDHLPGGQATG